MRKFLSLIFVLSFTSAFSQSVTVWKNGKVVAIVQNPDSVSMDNNYVDLGLSVKWATRNVGAKNCYDDGDYFAWAEVEPKGAYSWGTYKFNNSSATKMTKYSVSSMAAAVDGKLLLEPDDDAATVNVGPCWRTPTLDEMNELITNCDWTWTDNYDNSGKAGYVVTSNIDGFKDKSMFLPAAGHAGGSYAYDVGTMGMYWTSVLDYTSYGCIKAAQLYFENGSCNTISYDREIGMPVRPVVGRGEYYESKLPLFLGELTNNSNVSYFIVYVKVVALDGYPFTNYGFEFSDDEDFSSVTDVSTLPNCIIGYDPNTNVLQVNLPYKYVMEHFGDSYIRAFATCSEGTSYRE